MSIPIRTPKHNNRNTPGSSRPIQLLNNKTFGHKFRIDNLHLDKNKLLIGPWLKPFGQKTKIITSSVNIVAGLIVTRV
jgi:hypothetical protein